MGRADRRQDHGSGDIGLIAGREMPGGQNAAVRPLRLDRDPGTCAPKGWQPHQDARQPVFAPRQGRSEAEAQEEPDEARHIGRIEGQKCTCPGRRAGSGAPRDALLREADAERRPLPPRPLEGK